MTTVNKSDKDRVVIFDTTLRDGEQCPGATMTFEEKLEIAEMLDDMGVDVIEAGFPITSEGDFQAVSEIARRSKNAVIAGLSRAHPKDIDRCAEAVKFAKRGRVHTVIATSPLHMRVKLNMTPEQVIETSIANVARARNHIDDVEWSAEDGTRSEMEFLCRIVEAVIKAGATTVNIPDTVGYTVPEEYTRFMRNLIERVPNSDKAVFSVHCHNDLGMAVANSLAGIAGGARQIEYRRRRAADRMHRQRHRRAGRQCRARGSRDGHQYSKRRVSLVEQDRHHHADAGVETGIGGDVVSGAVQQGDRRPQCIRA